MTVTPPPTSLSDPASPTELADYQAEAMPKSARPIYLIVATTLHPPMGIGIRGGLPWPPLAKDMAFFRKVTTNGTSSAAISSGLTNAVLMGRKTYFSIPPKFRPLNDRVNIVLTRPENAENLLDKIFNELSRKFENDVIRMETLPSGAAALTKGEDRQPTVVIALNLQQAVEVEAREVYCIGGAEIYGLVLREESLKDRVRVLRTDVRKTDDGEFEIDTFWPGGEEAFIKMKEVQRDDLIAWTGVELPQGEKEWVKDEKSGLELRVRGFAST